MANTALNRTVVALLTNKSGVSVAQGDTVVVDETAAASFTRTTTGGLTGSTIGVVVEPNGIANNALGLVAVGGWVPKITLNAAAALGDTFSTHTAAGQATPHASVQKGDFGQVLGTGTAPQAILWGGGHLVITSHAHDGVDGSGTVKAQIIFTVEGTLTVGDKPLRIYNPFGYSKTISKVLIAVNTAPTGAAIICDVHKSGVTIFTNQANRPQIAISANSGESSNIDVPTWADGQYLQIGVDQIGSTVAGADLTIQVVLA